MTDVRVRARALLRQGMLPHWIHVEEGDLLRLEAEFSRRLVGSGLTGKPGDGGEERLLTSMILDEVSAVIKGIALIQQGWKVMTERYSRSEIENQQMGYVLDHAATLEAEWWRLWDDHRSSRRWFGYEAILDRYLDSIGEQEKRLTFLLDRLGMAAASALRAGESADYRRLWRQLDLEPQVIELLHRGGDRRVQAAAIRCLTLAIQGIPQDRRQGSVGEATLRVLYRSCLDSGQDIWVQCAALEALVFLSPSDFAEVAECRLRERGASDDIFVRRRVVELLGGVIADRPEFSAVLVLGADDPSPHVRQAASGSATRMPAAQAFQLLRRLAIADLELCVRVAALLGAMDIVKAEPMFVSSMVSEVLDREADTVVLRTALRVLEEGASILAKDSKVIMAWCETASPALARLRTDSHALAVRRWAAMTAEWLWCVSTPKAYSLYHELVSRLSPLRFGRWHRLSNGLVEDAGLDMLGRVLSILARDDFGYEVVESPFGFWVFKGERMRWRLWRMLHEMSRPGSDKRQGHSHLIGRIFWGRLQAPPVGLGELSQTTVPGEPLIIADEQSWRPYLPLPDQILSAIDSGGKTHIYTAEGVTVIRAPDGFAPRLLARLRFSRGFARFARLRNWHDGEGHEPGGYAAALKGLGVELSYQPHADHRGCLTADPMVRRFFPMLVPWIDQDLGARIQSYIFSVYENTLGDLALFLLAISVIFFGGLIWMNSVQRRNRKALSLVIGGWGTRGKSGTERLKAAMFNAIGYGLMSKTTGCEAMLLYSRPFRPLREMFLFRPYDKATIWEQVNVVRMARAMGSKVFLWECMGLKPAYVHILQSQWMRDDFSTITNTYPDHEDIQGPAGRDIPRVMTNFIPRRATLVTSEEQMLPILAEAAETKGTRCLSVGWQEATLIAPDILARFPYEEHPYNIALVLQLASELGIPRDFALKEMADRVVPDLGVLKSYPVASINGRRLEFVNGMSANERYGCLANWKRMGFDIHDPAVQPGVWLTTVVNNRADRVARSQVFAGILAEDISADCHVFIGSNLKGLQGFVRASWAKRIEDTSLWRMDGAVPVEVLDHWARWLRIPRSADQVAERGRAMLRGLGASEALFDGLDPLDVHGLRRRLERDDVSHRQAFVSHIEELGGRLQQYAGLAERLGSAQGRNENLDHEFRDLLSEWFLARIVVIEDVHATGDEIVQAIVARTPPGLLNRIMGLQNIKGTGLDFVYRWQIWDRCHAALQQLGSDRAETSMTGLRELAALANIGVLGEELVRHALAEANTRLFFRAEAFQSLANTILAGLAQTRDEAGVNADRKKSGAVWGRFIDPMIEVLEQFLDTGDAVWRRKKADKIYKELAAQQIGAERAVVELRDLNSRQKGGWLRNVLIRNLMKSGGG